LALAVGVVDPANGNEQELDFVLDSGATVHMVGEKYKTNLFDLMAVIPAFKLLQADRSVLPAVEFKGSLRVMINNRSLVITDVHIVRGQSFNLLSIPRLLHRNFTVRSAVSSIGIIVSDPTGHDIFTASLNSNDVPVVTFKLPVAAKMTDTATAIPAIAHATSIQQWHRRLAHINVDDIRQTMKLFDEQLSTSTPDASSQCEHCRDGKTASLPHSATMQRANLPNALVHGDIVEIGDTSLGCKIFYSLDRRLFFISIYFHVEKQEQCN
jgi:hypothetical protein